MKALGCQPFEKYIPFKVLVSTANLRPCSAGHMHSACVDAAGVLRVWVRQAEATFKLDPGLSKVSTTPVVSQSSIVKRTQRCFQLEPVFQSLIAKRTQRCFQIKPVFQSLIAKKTQRCFQLEPVFVCELAPLHLGAVPLQPARPGRRVCRKASLRQGRSPIFDTKFAKN